MRASRRESKRLNTIQRQDVSVADLTINVLMYLFVNPLATIFPEASVAKCKERGSILFVGIFLWQRCEIHNSGSFPKFNIFWNNIYFLAVVNRGFRFTMVYMGFTERLSSEDGEIALTNFFLASLEACQRNVAEHRLQTASQSVGPFWST